MVPHRYPITPYHADYIGHADRDADTKPSVLATADAGVPVTVRAQNAGSEDMVLHRLALHPTDWDIRFDEVAINEVLRAANVGFNAWPAPPWVKEGWFQAYHLLQPAVSGAAERKHADELYRRLVEADYRDLAERLNIARELITELTRGCDRAVIGYRLRREFYSDDFSNGIENIAVDSQFGFNSAVVAAHAQAQGSAVEWLAPTGHRHPRNRSLEPGCRVHGRARPAGVGDRRRRCVFSRPVQQSVGSQSRRGSADGAIDAAIHPCPRRRPGAGARHRPARSDRRWRERDDQSRLPRLWHRHSRTAAKWRPPT